MYGSIRDWSLITGRGGGATKREGGMRSLTPTKSGCGESFSHAERGGGAQIVYPFVTSLALLPLVYM